MRRFATLEMFLCCVGFMCMPSRDNMNAIAGQVDESTELISNTWTITYGGWVVFVVWWK